MMMWGYGYSWPMIIGMFFWNIIWLVLLALLVWRGIVWLQQSATDHRPHSASTLSALEILRQRYARGEIDDATFARMRERLGEELDIR